MKSYGTPTISRAPTRKRKLNNESIPKLCAVCSTTNHELYAITIFGDISSVYVDGGVAELGQLHYLLTD